MSLVQIGWFDHGQNYCEREGQWLMTVVIHGGSNTLILK